MKRFSMTVLLILVLALPAGAAPTLGGPTSPDGKTRVTIDLPPALRHDNTVGRDGSGLCVFWSITFAARWQKETALEDFAVLMQSERGGGWPQRVDQMIAKYAPGVDYLQYEGRDPVVIQAALKGKRLPAVTYAGRDPHYKGWIAHMVNVVHYDERWVCILDNNHIGENDLVWMTPAEFLQRWRGKGSGWAVVLLKEPPQQPPSPGPTRQRHSQARGSQETVKYVWYYHRGDPYRIYLYCQEDYLVGAYDFRELYFRFYAGDEEKWLAKCRPPFPPPLVVPHQPSGPVATAEDYGVPLDMFPPRSDKEERWTRKGQPASKAELLLLLEPRNNPHPSPAGPEETSLGSAGVVGLGIVILSLFGKGA